MGAADRSCPIVLGLKLPLHGLCPSWAVTQERLGCNRRNSYCFVAESCPALCCLLSFIFLFLSVFQQSWSVEEWLGWWGSPASSQLIWRKPVFRTSREKESILACMCSQTTSPPPPRGGANEWIWNCPSKILRVAGMEYYFLSCSPYSFLSLEEPPWSMLFSVSRAKIS